MMENQDQSDKDSDVPHLRYDLISKDWVVVASGRGKNPASYKKQWQRKEVDPETCVFCNIRTQAEPILVLSSGVRQIANPLPYDWTLAVIPNKFPAFVPFESLDKKTEGQFYETMNAAGYCEIVIPRDHYKHPALMEVSQIKELFDAYQARYRDLSKKKFVNYISIFHNHGVEAGASQAHPHSQIITSPLVDSDLQRALDSAKKYYDDNGVCANCQMNAWEEKEKKRTVISNDKFLALCPFASKAMFEVLITPRQHLSNFEETNEDTKWALAEIFSAVVKKLYAGLNNPPYNFYIHTAPPVGQYPYFHWHITIVPRVGYMGGFEFGTRMEIVVVKPETAAEYLRDL
jgi:UDPglucose--hexose-1-phosphate uridylyltransferase